nr:MAG TPA: hypothetical protein [Caudoviricetes sp.]
MAVRCSGGASPWGYPRPYPHSFKTQCKATSA